MAGEIQPIDDFEKMIAEIESIDQGSEILDKLDILEQMLKKADVWHEKARQFIALEARALIKVAEIFLAIHPNYDPEDDIPEFGSVNKRSNKYGTLCWLIEITQEERWQAYDIAVSSCSSLVQVWKDYVVEPHREKEALEDLERYKERVVETFEKSGEVRLSDYDYILRGASRYLSPSVIKGFKDETRDEVRKRGGHGLGDGEGTYMNADRYKLEVSRIVENKVNSIRLDLHRLNEVAADEDGHPVFSIRRKHNMTDKLTIESSIGIAMMMMDIGECDWGQCSEFSRLRMVAKAIEKLGYTPYEFIVKLVTYCNAYGVSLQQYGFPEKFGEE